ncbi:MAG TPA: hypothetical protein VF132_10920, partial [Rudaea sp.]
MHNQTLRSFQQNVLVAALMLGLGVAPDASATRHAVTVCSDKLVTPSCLNPDDSTLRKAYFCAHDNDSIDLTDLKACTITLTAPLTGYADNVTLIGPGRSDLIITGSSARRVIVHNGTGTL